MSQENWEEQLEEQKAYAKRIYKQIGGRLALDLFPDDPPPETIMTPVAMLSNPLQLIWCRASG